MKLHRVRSGRKELWWVVGAALCALLMSGCSASRATAARPLPPPLPPGPLFAARASFRYALIHTPKPGAPALPSLEARLRERYPALRLAGEASDAAPLPTVRVTEQALKDYPLPDQGMLEVAARNLAPEEQARLAASERVTLLHFTTEPPAVEAVRQAQALALELARDMDALLWDEQMVELFSVKDWHERRLEDWNGGEPLLPRHFNTQVYSEWDGTVNLITAGLTTFGLPELGVQQVPAPLSGTLGSFLNIVAQLMLEGTAVREDGAFPVALDALKLADWREALKQQVRPDARQRTLIGLLPVDPNDVEGLRMVEVIFQAHPGDTPSERPYAAVAELFGARSEIVSADEDDAELQAASRAAREALLTRIKPRFQEGLESESRLLVKAPFDTSAGGIEWMWVHVTGWEGTSLKGTLDSQPADVPGLKAGAQVTVSEESLFDYLLRREDGSVEGNTTERIILERAGRTP
ncbi:DUF2314 domain-containing protein [Myxococcus sp. RHSTA-1-4]|uniref:DUF2314 domain-containing protein n=1 Tax=Myxococcus sp. RHSTA-1-4 TaxID=2874601 RepID=UPI001CBD58A1|nr:DUF2314 domain-containing protein [Myxococcus sp. RHSTA-1-4]MBZ4418531.1 DUF2314 domain-containing protein [Myxococcus sp. RHSTA-1-4]